MLELDLISELDQRQSDPNDKQKSVFKIKIESHLDTISNEFLETF